MKTTVSVQKTENRNVRTAKMRILVVLTGVALFGMMASVQAAVNKGMASEGERSLLASASVSYLAPTSVRMHAAEALLEESREEMLEVESWMISESYFALPEAEALLEESGEEMLEVESWMISESYFAWPVPVAESEEPLDVEQWMLTEQHFLERPIVEERENTLEVEGWMLSESVWGH